MDSTTKEHKRTMPDVSDASGIGLESSIVPAGSRSSSDQGQSELLTSGNSMDMATGEVLQDASKKQEGRADLDSTIKGSLRSSDEQKESMDIEKEVSKRKRVSDSDEDEFNVSSAPHLTCKLRVIADSSDPEEIIGTEDLSIKCEHSKYTSGEDATDNKSVVSLYQEGVYIVDKENGSEKQEKKRGRGRPKKERRKVIGVQDLEVHELSDSEDNEGFNVTSTAKAGARTLEYLESVDQIRIKCRNIKGDLPGIMKKRLKDSKEIIRATMRKIERKKVIKVKKKRRQIRKERLKHLKGLIKS